MARYLVRQRSSLVASLGGAMRSLAASQRTAQIAEVSHLRGLSEQAGELDTVFQDFNCQVLPQQLPTSVTGIRFVDIQPDQAERLMRERPDLMVLRDQPMELITPQRPLVANIKAKPTAQDLWHLSEVGLTQAARKRLKATGAGVTVAVLDTGIQGDHPELHGKVKKTVRFDTTQWQATEETTSTDTQGHGTHVAGLIVGKTVGIAPGADLFNAIMIPNARGWLSDFVLAMEWCAQQPEVQIVNMSAGIPGWINGMEDVVADLLRVGVLPIIATGNEGANHTRSPGNYSDVLSVGATTSERKVAPFSSGGRLNPDAHVWIVPDLVAPGANVMSCVMGGGYEAWDGTSMATPIVSGLAALLLEHYGGDRRLQVAELQEMLLETCIDLNVASERQGRGLIQLHPALNAQGSATKKAVKGAVATKKAKAPVKAAAKKSVASLAISARKAGVKKTPGGTATKKTKRR